MTISSITILFIYHSTLLYGSMSSEMEIFYNSDDNNRDKSFKCGSIPNNVAVSLAMW